ncbi:hypothetical protein TrispH2_004360, partial [Trichoplax sp. H2]
KLIYWFIIHLIEPPASSKSLPSLPTSIITSWINASNLETGLSAAFQALYSISTLIENEKPVTTGIQVLQELHNVFKSSKNITSQDLNFSARILDRLQLMVKIQNESCEIKESYFKVT